MKNHNHDAPAQLRSLLAACAMLCSATGAFAASPLYQWNFNNSNGANTGTATGGTLALDVGLVSGPTGYAAGSFSGAGVSGTVNDKAFNAQNAYDQYWGGQSYSPITNAASLGSIDLSGVTQFTITLWVKRDGSRNVDLLNIGSATTPGRTSNPGITIGLNDTWDNNKIHVGVNGYSAGTGDLWSPGTDNDWCFLAFAYDGNGQVWWDPAMQALYGAHANGAIITGDTTTAASVAANLNMHIGDWGTAPGIASVGATATIFLANDGTTTNGFNGQLDDIRIYNGLLTVSEIEAIRVEAIAIPEPSSCALVFGFVSLAGVALRRRRRV